MVFSSVVFLFCFFPVVFLGYYLVGDRLKNGLLLIASAVFYAWGEPKYIFLILLSTIVNYFLGFRIDSQQGNGKKIVLAGTVLFNLGILAYFKYSSFFAQVLYSLTNIDLNQSILVSKSAMPIGISFFTFQILSYQIDVFRGEVPVQKRLSNLALYIMLFPQMIAGPIVRYSDIQQEIENRSVNMEEVYLGLKRFMLGFSQKILISNTMALAADYAYTHIGISAALSWVGAVCYMLQIYFDFSGYSDMAIGMGRMLGFHFAENFNYPYVAASMRDFWHRWHISLSTWFRDYLYIPLGGNRKGVVRTYLNQLVVFFATGLWHGASFNFVVWGLYHGVFLCAERMIGTERLKKLPQFFMHLYALLVVLFGWVLFRADSLADAWTVIVMMLSPAKWNWQAILPIINKEFLLVFAVAIFCAGGIPSKLSAVKKFPEAVKDVMYGAMFVLSILYMVGTDFNPFIYFRF